MVPCSTEALQGCGRTYVQFLARHLHRPLPTVIVYESADQDQRPNIHFLIGGVQDVPDAILVRTWKHGNFTLRRPIHGGAYRYLAEKVHYHNVPWELWPPRFRRALNRIPPPTR